MILNPTDCPRWDSGIHRRIYFLKTISLSRLDKENFKFLPSSSMMKPRQTEVCRTMRRLQTHEPRFRSAVFPNVNNPSTINGDHIMDFSSFLEAIA